MSNYIQKSIPWFRFYTEAIDNEKLGLLAFEDRWHFVALLCLKGKGILDNESDLDMLFRKVAFKMGLTVAELEKVIGRLAGMKLIDKKTLQPLGWGDRQMLSDSSSARVKAFREREAAAKFYLDKETGISLQAGNDDDFLLLAEIKKSKGSEVEMAVQAAKQNDPRGRAYPSAVARQLRRAAGQNQNAQQAPAPAWALDNFGLDQNPPTDKNVIDV